MACGARVQLPVIRDGGFVTRAVLSFTQQLPTAGCPRGMLLLITACAARLSVGSDPTMETG